MSLYRAIQDAVDLAIHRHQFQMTLPPLDDDALRQILYHDYANADVENDRLEFLGDAMMHATIGRLLYCHLPRGYPYLYTKCAHALWSNETFCKLAETLDIYTFSPDVLYALDRRTFGTGGILYKDHSQIKHTADLFETILGAYYLQSGFEAFYSWVERTFIPLIYMAEDAYWRNFHLAYPRNPYKDRAYIAYGRVMERYRSISPLPRPAHHHAPNRRSSEPFFIERALCYPDNIITAQAQDLTSPGPGPSPNHSIGTSSSQTTLVASPTPTKPSFKPTCIDLTMVEDTLTPRRLTKRDTRSAAPSPEPIRKRRRRCKNLQSIDKKISRARDPTRLNLELMQVSDLESDDEMEVCSPNLGESIPRYFLRPPTPSSAYCFQDMPGQLMILD
ncbi:unnamed protein product [Somion occarium]|uniref:RNase III domain-containing protein n=1 Tax=Somion occarium TaxID=3059160 RepID=A0ABP1CNA4_9APHY